MTKKCKIFNLKLREIIAIFLYHSGLRHSCSTAIDEDTIIAGYGSLDIDFYYPLPVSYVKKIYGTTSWSEYLKKDEK